MIKCIEEREEKTTDKPLTSAGPLPVPVATPVPAPFTDSEPPVITAIGSKKLKDNLVSQCDIYIDEGAFVTDNIDDDLVLTANVVTGKNVTTCMYKMVLLNELS